MDNVGIVVESLDAAISMAPISEADEI